MVFSWRQFCLTRTIAVKPGTKRKIQGMMAKSFAAKVEKLHGAKSAANSPSAKTKLVEAKLDVVRAGWLLQHVGIVGRLCCFDRVDRVRREDRKSTRLNSSHEWISYAVFCLKKKKKMKKHKIIELIYNAITPRDQAPQRGR